MYNIHNDLPNAQKLYTSVDLESIFPKEVLDSVLNFQAPDIRYKNFEEII